MSVQRNSSENDLAIVPSKVRELSENYLSQILELHQRGLQLDERIREVVAEKIEVTRQTGRLIEMAQKQFKHAFDDLIGRFLGITRPMLKAYIKICHREKQPKAFKSMWHSLRDAGPATNLLPAPAGYSNPLRLHTRNFFATAVKLLTRLRTE